MQHAETSHGVPAARGHEALAAAARLVGRAEVVSLRDVAHKACGIRVEQWVHKAQGGLTSCQSRGVHQRDHRRHCRGGGRGARERIGLRRQHRKVRVTQSGDVREAATVGVVAGHRGADLREIAGYGAGLPAGHPVEDREPAARGDHATSVALTRNLRRSILWTLCEITVRNG